MIALVELGISAMSKEVGQRTRREDPSTAAIPAKQERGVALITKAIGINANFAPTHDNMAYGLANLAIFGEALASFCKAIALMPDYARR